MGLRLDRHKPRHWLASLAYKLNRFLPFSEEQKLDFMLDFAWVAHRLSIENASKLGLNRTDENRFLRDRIAPTDRVLEIGCAGGTLLATLDAAERVGLDHDRAAIEEAKARYPGISFVAGDAREYLGQSGHFDVLIVSHVLEHIDAPEEFLASLKDRFERIYIEVPDLEWTDLNRIRLERKRRLIYMDNDHVAEFDREELEGIFQGLGLTILDREFRFGVMRYWVTPEVSRPPLK